MFYIALSSGWIRCGNACEFESGVRVRYGRGCRRNGGPMMLAGGGSARVQPGYRGCAPMRAHGNDGVFVFRETTKPSRVKALRSQARRF